MTVCWVLLCVLCPPCCPCWAFRASRFGRFLLRLCAASGGLLCLLSLFLLLVVFLFAVGRLRFGLGRCLRVLVAAAFLFRLRSAGWPLLRLVLLRFGWLRSVLVVLFLSSSLPCPRCLRVAGVFLAVLVAARFFLPAELPRGLLLLASLNRVQGVINHAYSVY